MGGMAMGGTLVPEWARWIWFAVYIVILVIHVSHMVTMKGQHRAWHASHTLMALGMAWMFLPLSLKIIPAVAWQIVFALAACLIAGWCIWNWSQHRAVNFLWIPSLIAMLAMIYMFAFPGAANRVLTYVLVVYFVLEAIAWLVGGFDETEAGRRRLLPYAVGPRSGAAYKFAQSLADADSLSIRLSLAVMAVGMAYMFVAMQVAL